jgi:transcription elongation factor GreB
MSRYRPPRPPSSPYITAAGYRVLETELKGLWERRADVVKHLAAAAAEGDRSENAEYQYRKKELRGIDSRIGYLQRRMPKLKVVAATPPDTGKVFFGASVELEDDAGATHVYRIVGSDETDAARGCISIDSPLARALLGKTFDDEVQLGGEAGARRYLVLDIRYADAAPAPAGA